MWSGDRGCVVEDKIDIQRVLTAPLSLHRPVDRVAVCVPPEELEDFHVDWPALTDTSTSRMHGAGMKRVKG